MISDEIGDKYEVINILQKTAATAVLLVREKSEGEIRILKAIQKSHPDSARILSEANLLSEVISPKIPTIYDYGQMSNWNYLVEEYVEGQPLQEFLLENKPVQLNRLLSILIELCKVISLLHISAEEPILYRDMKPEHIIIREESVKVIDFGAAERMSKVSKTNCYCSKSFASPEQLQCEMLDERSDVYGIGKVIEYCLEYVAVFDRYKLMRIAKNATATDVSKRVSSVIELQKQLETLRGKRGNEKLRTKYLNKKIAVVGSESGVGCTHIAINMCKYLNSSGISSYFMAADGKKTVQMLGNNLNSYNIKDGILYHEGFKGCMDYGPAVEAMSPPNGTIIIDYGVVEEKPNTEIVIYVLGLKPWMELDVLPKWVKDKNVIIISNFGNTLSTLDYSKIIEKKIYIYSKYSRPFKISSKERKIFELVKREIVH